MNKSKIDAQLERFKQGFPWLDIVDCATPQRGIKVLGEEEQIKAAEYFDGASVKGKCKFVPASGAASRMFKDIFAGMDKANDATRKLADNLEEFAFYDEKVFGKAPFNPEDTARKLLTEEGLGYGSKPKGVLAFHRYEDEVRTALAEHLVEGQAYMRNADGSVKIVVTISPEHEHLFREVVGKIREEYEKRYGVRYDISFTYQDKETDTVAADMENKPFLKDDGSMVFRPAGHGALIYNLNAIEDELVSIKNIDNVSNDRFLPVTAKYKKVLMGVALSLRDRIFGYLNALDAAGDTDCSALCDEIEKFLADELSITLPATASLAERVAILRSKLDRPSRVCGMVRNQGEPGGGPFIVKSRDGSSNLQILESVQINMGDEASREMLAGATHFNPVDLVCCLRNYKGEKFNLLDYVDQDAGFISSKSYQGRELKALELPGLWNGSMSDWNTCFVEVPLETFNPVKVVLDLLRPAHQGE